MKQPHTHTHAHLGWSGWLTGLLENLWFVLSLCCLVHIIERGCLPCWPLDRGSPSK